ncbi:MAG: hypothetical protein PHV37_06325 [Candidatus Gastranaerophilales bacterium]|nr:hypothetical protein [Candidatus Gastranaerophilales bacterium]
MKKTLYILLGLLIATTTANAYVDNQYMLSEQYTVNTGLSKEMARELQIKAKDVYSPLPEKADTRTWYMKLYNYVDPVSNTNFDYPGHDLKNYNSWEDL